MVTIWKKAIPSKDIITTMSHHTAIIMEKKKYPFFQSYIVKAVKKQAEHALSSC